MASLRWYLKEFLRPEWIHSFFFARTAPLSTPSFFRDFPVLTEMECTHCRSCMMICPAPGAINVVYEGGIWFPEIAQGHCVRCGMCVEACPEDVLASGRILPVQHADGTFFRADYHIQVDHDLCMRCGNCCVSCPVNKEVDPQMGSGGYSANDEVIMRIEQGKHRLIHEERCVGCKTCEGACPNRAIQVAKVVEALQESRT